MQSFKEALSNFSDGYLSIILILLLNISMVYN